MANRELISKLLLAAKDVKRVEDGSYEVWRVKFVGPDRMRTSHKIGAYATRLDANKIFALLRALKPLDHFIAVNDRLDKDTIYVRLDGEAIFPTGDLPNIVTDRSYRKRPSDSWA